MCFGPGSCSSKCRPASVSLQAQYGPTLVGLCIFSYLFSGNDCAKGQRILDEATYWHLLWRFGRIFGALSNFCNLLHQCGKLSLCTISHRACVLCSFLVVSLESNPHSSLFSNPIVIIFTEQTQGLRRKNNNWRDSICVHITRYCRPLRSIQQCRFRTPACNYQSQCFRLRLTNGHSIVASSFAHVE